jgi:hypothetical protein
MKVRQRQGERGEKGRAEDLPSGNPILGRIPAVNTLRKIFPE